MILPSSGAYTRESFVTSLLRAMGFFLFYSAVRTVVFNTATIVLLMKYEDKSIAEKAYYENANMLSFICGAIIVVALTVFFSRRQSSVRELVYVGKPSASTVIFAFFVGISLNFATSHLLTLLPQRLVESYKETASDALQGPLVWYVLAAVVMAPVIEELIFRAMIVSRLSTSVGNFGAVAISSAIFGAVHGHIVWSSYAFLLGLLLGSVFVRTRSLAVSIAMHTGFNLVSLTSYINTESLGSIGKLDLSEALSLIYTASVPVSVLLVFLFFVKTRATYDKKPIGLEEINSEGVI